MTFWAILKHNFQLKPAVATLWATFGKIGLLFISTSGHIVGKYGYHVLLQTLVREIHCEACFGNEGQVQWDEMLSSFSVTRCWTKM